MKPEIFCFRTLLPFSSKRILDWHLSPDAVKRMVPPWHQVRFLSPPGSPKERGSRLELMVRIGSILGGSIWRRWILEHREYIEGHGFCDVQIQGPFSYWRHFHRVHSKGEGAAILEEEIHFALFTRLLVPKVREELQRTFAWRHETLSHDLSAYEEYRKPPLRILISGSSGLVGRPIVNFLKTAGHQVTLLLRGRGESSQETIYWDPESGSLRREDFEGFDAMVHLAGKNLATLWTKRAKREILNSRVRDTWLLSQVLLRLYRPPKVFLAASAVGYYGCRRKGMLTEESEPGRGFLADVCKKWEAASQLLEGRGTRVVHARFGAIISPSGGLLRRVLPPFRLGLAPILGGGRQKMAWIALEDVVYALYHCLISSELQGAVNFTAPQIISHEEFVEAMLHKLGTRLKLHVPAAMLRLFFRTMADELFLSSLEVSSQKLIDSGFHFHYPNLGEALRYLH